MQRNERKGDLYTLRWMEGESHRENDRWARARRQEDATPWRVSWPARALHVGALTSGISSSERASNVHPTSKLQVCSPFCEAS